MHAIAEVLRVVRAVLSLSLIQPRPRLPTLAVTPLRPAEHYHTAYLNNTPMCTPIMIVILTHDHSVPNDPVVRPRESSLVGGGEPPAESRSIPPSRLDSRPEAV